VSCGERKSCSVRACFVLKSLVLAPSGGKIETDPDYVWGRWQGNNNCPFVVDAKPSSWGRVKANYR